MRKVTSALHFIKPHNHSAAESSESYWIPNTDVYVTAEGVVIKVELSGMRREDLELVVEKNTVKITGHRPDGCRAPKCKFLLMEINYGTFERIIELPDGYEVGQARAAYHNGFLRIDVPAKTESSSGSESLTPESS